MNLEAGISGALAATEERASPQFDQWSFQLIDEPIADEAGGSQKKKDITRPFRRPEGETPNPKLKKRSVDFRMALKSEAREGQKCRSIFGPISSQNILHPLARLNEAAAIEKPFDSALVSKLRLDFEGNLISRQDLIDATQDQQNFGRTRWLIFDILSESPDRQWQEAIVRQLEICEDPWLLSGVATLIRQKRMDSELRPSIRDAFLKRLSEYLDYPNSTRDKVSSVALGECILAVSSFAVASDVNHIAPFALEDWELKPRVCAFNSLARLANRFYLKGEVDHLFETHQDALKNLGVAFASTWRSSEQSGTLLAAWAELMMARLGPEGELAVNLAIDRNLLIRSIRQQIHKRQRQLPADWIESRRSAIDSWLVRLDEVLPRRKSQSDGN